MSDKTLEKAQEKEKDKKRKRNAWTAAFIFHAGLLIAFFLISWKEPNPLPEPIPLEVLEFEGGGGDQGGAPAESSESTSEESSPEESQPVDDKESEVEVPKNPNTSVKPNNTNTTPTEEKSNNPFTGNNGGGSSTGGNLGGGTGNNPGTGGGLNGGNGPGNGQGNGPGLAISGRKQVGKPENPGNPNRERGTIVMNIWVNKKGIVTRAEYNADKSTASDVSLIKNCKAKLEGMQIVNEDEAAAESQKGSYTFIFNAI